MSVARPFSCADTAPCRMVWLWETTLGVETRAVPLGKPIRLSVREFFKETTIHASGIPGSDPPNDTLNGRFNRLYREISELD